MLWLKQLHTLQTDEALSALQVITAAEEAVLGTIDKNKQSGGMHVSFHNATFTSVRPRQREASHSPSNGE